MSRTVSLALVCCLSLSAQVKQLKPGFNLFSPQQDLQLGKEAAAEVEKTQPVVKNDELTGYLTRIGGRLAKSKRAGTFPFTFQVIHDKSINAFALPGGPMFVHTGLLTSVDNEAQLAGVLAHEMSHVALRHGTHQASKANFIQIPAMLAGAVVGNNSIWASAAQLGLNLGAGSLLLRYSRDAERDADLNGAQMMNDAGYNPSEMARFFAKLESDGKRDNSKLANFLSDHPTPGNRVQYVEEQNKYLPKVQYTEPEASTLSRVKNIVASLPPPPPPAKAATTAAGGAVPAPATARPSARTKQFQGKAYSLNYPDNWQTFGGQDSPAVTIAPREGMITDARGQSQIGYGLMASYSLPQGDYVDLSRDTENLVQQLLKSNANMRRGSDPKRSVTVAGQKGVVTMLESQSPYPGEVEVDMLVTVPRPEGLFYVVLIAPRSEWSAVQRPFDDMVKSIRFPN